MTLDDIPALPGLRPEGWNDISDHFRYNVLSPLCDPIKVVTDDKIVGVGANIMNEDTAWMASVIVLPEYRNRGIGKMIVDTLLARLDREQFQTVLLDATTFGYPVYKKVGFETISEHVHFTGEALSNADISSHILPFEERYKQEVLALDRTATGENRSAYLLEHIADCKIYLDKDGVRGAYFPTTVRGMIIADSVEAGMALMNLRLRAYDACMVPIENTQAIKYLNSLGFKQTHTSARMRLGAPRKWRGDYIYNVVSGARG